MTEFAYSIYKYDSIIYGFVCVWQCEHERHCPSHPPATRPKPQPMPSLCPAFAKWVQNGCQFPFWLGKQENLEEDEGALNAEDIELLREAVKLGEGERHDNHKDVILRYFLQQTVASPPCHSWQVERCRFSEMDLGLGGEDLGMAEWLHFMLLRASAPSHVAAKHLNRHLRKALEAEIMKLERYRSLGKESTSLNKTVKHIIRIHKMS